ncbi:MAG: LamG domain-containing protein, partial [Candidatus Nanoarchaeia archaeon]|nr:LamG domain-containing protein [Candidatus Nanoarchaeia archaeon]
MNRNLFLVVILSVSISVACAASLSICKFPEGLGIDSSKTSGTTIHSVRYVDYNAFYTCYDYSPIQTVYKSYNVVGAEHLEACITSSCSACKISNYPYYYYDPNRFEAQLLPYSGTKFGMDVGFCGVKGKMTYALTKSSSWFAEGIGCSTYSQYKNYCELSWPLQDIACLLDDSQERCEREAITCCPFAEFKTGTDYGNFDNKFYHAMLGVYTYYSGVSQRITTNTPYYISQDPSTSGSGIVYEYKPTTNPQPGYLMLRWADLDPCDGPGQHAFPVPKQLFTYWSPTYTRPYVNVYAYTSLPDIRNPFAGAVLIKTITGYTTSASLRGISSPSQFGESDKWVYAGIAANEGERKYLLRPSGQYYPYYIYELVIDTEPYIANSMNEEYLNACPCVDKTDCDGVFSTGSCIATSCNRIASTQPTTGLNIYRTNPSVIATVSCPSLTDPNYDETKEGCAYSFTCNPSLGTNVMEYRFNACPNSIFSIDGGTPANPVCYEARTCSGEYCVYNDAHILDPVNPISITNEFGITEQKPIGTCDKSTTYASTSPANAFTGGAVNTLKYQGIILNNIVPQGAYGFCYKNNTLSQYDECIYDIACSDGGITAKTIICPEPGAELCLMPGSTEYEECSETDYTTRWCFYKPSLGTNLCDETGCNVFKKRMKSRNYVCDPVKGPALEIGGIEPETSSISALPSKMGAGFKDSLDVSYDSFAGINKQCVDWQAGQIFREGYLIPSLPYDEPGVNTRNPTCYPECKYPVCEYLRLDFSVDDVVIHFSFDTNTISSGKAYDTQYENLRKYEAVFVNANTVSSGCLQGECISFSGDGQVEFKYMSHLSDFSLANFLATGFSFGAWIKTSSSSGTIFSTESLSESQAGMELFISDGKLKIKNKYTNTEVSGNVVINDNKWHYILITYNYLTYEIKCYVDGIEDSSLISVIVFLGDQKIFLGDTFTGLIDELRIWKRLLSVGQAQSISENQIYSLSRFPYGETYVEKQKLQDRCRRIFGGSVSFCYDDFRHHIDGDIRLAFTENEMYCTGCISGNECEYTIVNENVMYYNLINNYDMIIFQYNPSRLIPVQIG